MTTTKNLLITTAVVALLLAATAFSALDWGLSHTLVTPGSHFGEFFNRFGELPAFAGLFVATFILFAARNREVLWRNGLSHVLALPFLALFAWVIFVMPIRYVYEFAEDGIPAAMMTVSQVLGAILFIAALVTAFKTDENLWRRYRRHAWMIIALVVLQVLVVNITKIIWGRPRMRSIESIDQFHYWYQIAGPAAGEEFKSFPSGHTANGFMMLILTLFVPKHQKQWLMWATAFAIFWGACVALSRVILGAHFLSDVIFGGYIAVLLFYALRGVFFKSPATVNT